MVKIIIFAIFSYFMCTKCSYVNIILTIKQETAKYVGKIGFRGVKATKKCNIQFNVLVSM